MEIKKSNELKLKLKKENYNFSAERRQICKIEINKLNF